MHHRDDEKERRASAMYEHLRRLTKDQLAEILGFRDARQVMIAEIILRRLGDPDYQETPVSPKAPGPSRGAGG